MTRKLDSKYKGFVECINGLKCYASLKECLSEFFDDNSRLNELAVNLDEDYYDYDESMDKFTSIIVDIYNGNYELEEPKYYVKMSKVIFPYLIQCENESFDWCSKLGNKKYEYQFTMSEIEAIDPRYKAFAVPVEDE
ncbi:hypothetical protein CPR19088_GLDEOEPO_01367 [Companilactobacillus paralimentarius]